ncbi:hypothetical protein GCM10009541_54660 [Micromonospora gifhornensis]
MPQPAAKVADAASIVATPIPSRALRFIAVPPYREVIDTVAPGGGGDAGRTGMAKDQTSMAA